MSRKYNTEHPMRGRSHYPERLRKRGVSNIDVRMPTLESLRRKSSRREAGLVAEDEAA